MRILVLCVLMICGIASHGQQTKLRLVSPDSTHFFASVNNSFISDSSYFVHETEITNPKNVRFQAYLKSDSSVIAELRSDLVEDHINTYSLMSIGEQYFFTYLSSTAYQEIPDSIITVKTIDVSDENVMVSENTKMRAEELSIVEIEPIETGCSIPMNSSEFESLKEEIESNYFQNKRTEIIEDALKSDCFTTDQLISLIELIEYQDVRLELLLSAKESIYDIGNYGRLESLLQFKRDIETFRKSIE